MNFSPKTTEILEALRKYYESSHKDANGVEWGSVYLPNVGSTRSFAGSLSKLKAAGYYKPMNSGDRDHDRYFGYVRLESGTIARAEAEWKARQAA